MGRYVLTPAKNCRQCADCGALVGMTHDAMVQHDSMHHRLRQSKSPDARPHPKAVLSDVRSAVIHAVVDRINGDPFDSVGPLAIAESIADAVVDRLTGEGGERTPRQRWGTCCPHDPHCEHSFLDVDDLARWMDSPISDTAATGLSGETS